MKYKAFILIMLTLAMLACIGIFIKIAVYISPFATHRIYDTQGNPISGIKVGRSYMFPLYGDSASGIENATTDNRGRAHIKTAHVYVPLWRYLYGNIYYQCANPCECCLGDCLDYIDKDSIPKRQNSVAVYNSKKQSNSIVTIIDYIPVIQSRSVNWSDINEDAIYRDALTIWKQGQITNIPKEIWGELNKFSPERVMTFEKGVGVRYSDGSGYQINLVRNENFQISEDEQTQFKYVSVYKK